MTSTPYQTTDTLGVRGVYQFAMSIPLANIATGNILSGVVLGHNGKILAIGAFPTTVATTAAKLATLTPFVGSTNSTDLALGLTSANMGTLGVNVVDNTTTGGTTFGPTDSVGIVASAVTAFSEGTATVYLLIQDTDNT